jgi:phage-related protein
MDEMMKKFQIPVSKQKEVTSKLKELIKEHSTGKPKTRKWPVRRPQCIQTFLNIRLLPTYQKKIKAFCQEHSITNQKAFELEFMKLIHFYCKMDLFLFSEHKFYKFNYHKTKRQMFNDFIKVAEKELDTVRPPCKEVYGCQI